MLEHSRRAALAVIGEAALAETETAARDMPLEVVVDDILAWLLAEPDEPAA